MKFDHLQASIINNKDQAPTLYMALCMVESLFLDMERGCGDISRCPVGDEHLPSKLVWLCRTVNDIYKDHSEDLQRNRSRLDAAMGKLNDTQQKLETLASVTKQLETLRNENTLLEQQLQTRNADARRCEELTAKCSQAKQQLEVLARFDPAAAERELKTLSSQIAEQKSRKETLSAQLSEAKHQADLMQQDADRTESEIQTVRGKIATLEAARAQALKEQSQLQADHTQLEADLSAAKQEQQQLTQTNLEITAELETLRKKIDDFQDVELDTKQAERDLARNELQALEASMSTVDEERKTLQNQCNQLIMDIARTKLENESLNGKYQKSQDKLVQLQQEKQQLQDCQTECLRKLSLLQEETDRLKNQTLPEATELCNHEQQLRDELQQSVDLCNAQYNAHKAETEKLKERLPKLEEAVKNERVVYEALTANCAASSKELANLERQTAELRNNSDEEKLEIYRKQLEETKNHLEQVRQDCIQIEQDNVQKQKQLEEGQAERARLLELKRRHESGIEVTAKQLQELAAFGTPDFLCEVTALEERQKLLEQVRKKLAASIDNMRQFLGCVPIEETVSLEDQMRAELRDLQQRMEDLRRTIVDCAKSINMEER